MAPTQRGQFCFNGINNGGPWTAWPIGIHVSSQHITTFAPMKGWRVKDPTCWLNISGSSYPIDKLALRAWEPDEPAAKLLGFGLSFGGWQSFPASIPLSTGHRDQNMWNYVQRGNHYITKEKGLNNKVQRVKQACQSFHCHLHFQCHSALRPIIISIIKARPIVCGGHCVHVCFLFAFRYCLIRCLHHCSPQ